jgi:TonB-linked SusC/RagA family outer membrane protein
MRFRVMSVLAVLALTAAPRGARAQGEALLTGKVTSAAGAPVEGAQVFLDKMALGTQTKSDGSYRFTVPAARATGQQALLSVRLQGFKPKSITIALTPGAINTDFQLETQAVVLQQLVITGEGTITTNEKLGATVNTVSSEEISRSNESNLTEGLAGKAPNVDVTQQSADPGSSVNIQIRGLKTFSGDGQPLFVVDGVPVDNSTLSTVGGGATNVGPDVGFVGGGQVAPNRIMDLNPNDVQSVTILKGSAAAAIYGARAAQGVVLITTKSGAAGPTRYALHSSYSFDKVTQGYDLQRTYGQGNGGVSGVNPDTDALSSSRSWGPQLAPGTQTYDHFAEMYETGHVADNDISISGGDDRRSFFLSGAINNNNGFVVGDHDSYKRSTFRLKASQLIGDKFKLGGNLAYTDSRGSYIQRGDNVSGIMLGGMRTPAEYNNHVFFAENGMYKTYRFQNPSTASATLNHGFDNPFWAIANAPSTSKLNRVVGNVDLNWEPFDWLKVQETAGGDYYTDARYEGLPQGDGSAQFGRVIRGDFKNYILDHNLTAIASHTFTPWLATTLTLGQNLNATNYNQVYAIGTTLVAPEPLVLQNVADYQVNDYSTVVHRESYFGQATADMWDQLFLTAALRNDGFSTFGNNNRRHWFPKASAAWTFTKAISGLTDKIDFAKVRAAFGKTGKEPSVYTTLSNYSVASFGEYGGDASGLLRTVYMGGAGLIGPLALGSDSLRPEVTREYETGIDVGLFKGFMDASLSYYDSKTTDVIFQAPVPPSSGATSIIRNAATITNKGIEVTTNFHPLRSGNFKWNFGANWSRNRNLVTQINGSNDIPVGLADVLTLARVGFPVGAMAGNDFIRCGRGLSVEGANIDNTICQGKPRGALYIAEDGFPVLDPNTLLILGTAEPLWTGSVHTDVTVGKHWNVSALLDIKHGGQMYNGTRGALYAYGRHKDTEVRGQVFVFGPSAGGVQGFHGDAAVVGPGAGTPVVIGEGWFGDPGSSFSGNVGDFIEDAGFTKLREISVGYTFDSGFIPRSLGLSSVQLRLAGRNLKTWTHYSGLDPETNVTGAGLIQGVDWFNNPQARSFVITVGLNR